MSLLRNRSDSGEVTELSGNNEIGDAEAVTPESKERLDSSDRVRHRAFSETLKPENFSQKTEKLSNYEGDDNASADGDVSSEGDPSKGTRQQERGHTTELER